MRHALIVAGWLGLAGCNLLSPVTPVTPLQEQIDESQTLLLTSARNALTEANTAVSPLIGRVSTAGIVDLEAFQAITGQVLPPLTKAAQSLSSLDGQTELRNEFKRLYGEGLTAMLEGINENLSLYQLYFETPQALDPAGHPELAQKALDAVAQLFLANDITERFVAQLGQYDQLLNKSEIQEVLGSLKNQQLVLINGAIGFAREGMPPASVQNAYRTLAQNLTSPQLLSQLADLATLAHGADNVAVDKREVTPGQPDPNRLAMVVREAADQYRLIQIQDNQLTNQLKTDNRGLTAADLLYQTHVIEVK